MVAAFEFVIQEQGQELDGGELALDGLGGPDGEGEGHAAQLELANADLAIYLACADPYAGDQLGRLALSKAGLARRDRLVFESCQGAGLPVAAVMSGGYGRQIEDTVEIHLRTVRIASEMARPEAHAFQESL